MELIIIGPGINHLVEVNELPANGAELNLGDRLLAHGVYRLTRAGARKMGGKEYPFYRRVRISDLPAGATPLPMTVMNC